MKKGIQIIYDEVAPTYELANHVLTFGLDSIWRRRAAREAGRCSGSLWMDICSGTGELARLLSRKAGEKTRVMAVDGSAPMLQRAKSKKNMDGLLFTLADVGKLPLPDASVDLITISFATRNLNPNPDTMKLFLKEFYRVLKPEGVFLNLETSQPKFLLLRKLFHLYIKMAVRPVGYLISGSKAGYNYLSHTIPRFYDAPGFAALLEETGFSQVRAKSLLMGIAAIHTAVR